MTQHINTPSLPASLLRNQRSSLFRFASPDMARCMCHADVLSYKAKTTACVEPIKYTIEYRTKYAEALAQIRVHGNDAVPMYKELARFNCTGMCGCVPAYAWQ